MTPRAPRVTAAQAMQVLQSHGFEVVRQKGSHAIMRNEAGRRVTVPVHAGRTLHPKVLASIMRDAGLSADDYS
ncbi:MAG: type II toxin-antitoxin system HicA family toxin [Actinobacteria bacterium]|nr:type II toxin-antitoxin system HicA family toxin [Actinomycetota bacterium]